MTAYYNEIDPYCAAWLQNLMDAGHIAPGVIDTRSIEDVRPDELAGYTQCHFFAGIGVWSLALRAAGWPDSRRAWTGSCPCQPFSAAGKGAGFADERHLWPAWQHLINQCRPAVIFGEQVASKAVDSWIDLVHTDLEGMGYAFGCVPFPSAGVGAPHIRDRNYWVADASDDRLQGRLPGWQGSGRQTELGSPGCGGAALRPCKFCGYKFDVELLGIYGCPNCNGEGLSDGRLANTDGRHPSAERQQRSGEQRQQPKDDGAGRMADAEIASEWGHTGVTRGEAGEGSGQARSPHGDANRGAGGMVCIGRTGPTNGFWRAADWLGCTDGRWRPVEPGTFPLVDGASSRVGRLRAYGNAISAPAAEAFIRSYCEARGLIDLEKVA